MREEGRVRDVEEDLLPGLDRVFKGLFEAAGKQHGHQGQPCGPLHMGCFTDAIRFQHYGVDVSVEDLDGKLTPYIFEVNE